MKKKKRRSNILIFIGLVMIAAAIILSAYNFWDDYRALSSAENVLLQLKQVQEQNRADSNQNKNTNSTTDGNSSDDGTDDEDGDKDSPVSDNMPTVEIDGYSYIGIVTILPLEIELPVMEEWDYTRMKISPCRYTGSLYTDNLIICAHNYNSHFGRLNKLQKNDEIVVTDVEGNSYWFSVAEIETLGGTAIEEMVSGDWDLTLFTCTYSGAARVAVRCVRIE